MNDQELETRLRARYRARAGETESAPLSLRRDAAAIPGTALLPSRRFGRSRGMTLLAAAAVVFLVGGALAISSGVLRQSAIILPAPGPSLVAVAVASPDANAPSPSHVPSTGPTAAPITWSQASLKEDWPVPVRQEPVGRPIDVPILLKTGADSSASGHLADATGDNGSETYSWADIKGVGFCGDTGTCLSIEFSSDGLLNGTLSADPSQLWFAYGVVVDTDGDGVADWRYGIDNEPLVTPGSTPRRWWRTDLRTGRTEYTLTEANWEGRGPFWGNHGFHTGGAGLSFGGDTTGGVRGGVPKHFYIWASVIKDGRVVAADYAPNAGWLVPSATAKP
jgi:hypothetical protein